MTSKQVKLLLECFRGKCVRRTVSYSNRQSISFFFVQKSTANWLRTLMFLKTKVLSWLVKVGGYFGLKAVTDKIGQKQNSIKNEL